METGQKSNSKIKLCLAMFRVTATAKLECIPVQYDRRVQIEVLIIGFIAGELCIRQAGKDSGAAGVVYGTRVSGALKAGNSFVDIHLVLEQMVT